MHEDKHLIEAAQQDVQQFSVLYEKYVDLIFKFIFYRVDKNRDVAEELVADVFTKALQNLNRFEWQGYPYSAYLYKVARSVCSQYYGKKTIVDIEDIQVEDSKTAQKITTQVELQMMWKQIATFSPEVQELFQLRYVEDLPYNEIAEIVGKKEGTIRTALSRAVSTLKEAYER